MKTIGLRVLVPLVALLAVVAACGNGSVATATAAPAATQAPESELDKTSYALGVTLAQPVPAEDLDLNIDQVLQGVRDALTGADLALDEAAIGAAMQGLQQQVQEASNKKAAAAQADGLAFLEENSKKDGVTVTESGLQYEVITAADGPKPTATDRVTVHYEGRLTNGDVFDSSIQRGEPVTFPLNQVIAGWTEGVQLMSPGAKYRFTIPSDLGYGAAGAGAKIPPNSTLVFDVELIKIEE